MIINCIRCNIEISKPGLTKVGEITKGKKKVAITGYNADYILAPDTKIDGIQKTGIICPQCYNPETDFIIWGYHKVEQDIRLKEEQANGMAAISDTGSDSLSPAMG